MEPRAIAAHYDRQADRLTVWRSTQSPFGTRSTLSAVLGRPEHTIRVIAPDVGGAFGAKGNLYPDELATVLLAMHVDRPVRWVSTRGEDLLFTLQGRDQVNLVDAAYTDAGEITALQVRCVHNLGGVQMHPVATPPMRVVDYATGAYRIQSYHAEGLGRLDDDRADWTVSRRGSTGGGVRRRADRRGGRPQAGLDPVEVRRRNFIKPDQFPYTNGAGAIYDSGNYELAVNRALELADYAGSARDSSVRCDRRQPRRRSRVPLFGIGVATTIEVSGQGQEFGSVEVQADGRHRRAHRLVVARPGARDQLCAGRRRRARECRSSTSACCTATPTRRPTAAAPAAAAAWWSAAAR